MTRISSVFFLAVLTACESAPERRAAMAPESRTPSAPAAKEENDANAAKDLKKRGAELARTRQWAEALPLFTEIVRLEPSNAGAWIRLGECRHFTGNFNGALEAWTKSIELRDHPVARYDMACAHARLGNEAAALDALERAVALGFSDANTMRTDTDLESLRDEPRFKAALEKVAAAPKAPLASPEARGFDFWIGDWNVTDTNGNQAGTSRVEKILNGFVLQENWTSASGGNGKSWNTYDPNSKRWRQHWVDDSGRVVDYVDGVREGNHLTVTTRQSGADGRTVLNRMTFFDIDPTHVRQLGETSADEGATWKSTFDLMYTRK